MVVVVSPEGDRSDDGDVRSGGADGARETTTS
jgi:hypothetical protein